MIVPRSPLEARVTELLERNTRKIPAWFDSVIVHSTRKYCYYFFATFCRNPRLNRMAMAPLVLLSMEIAQISLHYWPHAQGSLTSCLPRPLASSFQAGSDPAALLVGWLNEWSSGDACQNSIKSGRFKAKNWLLGSDHGGSTTVFFGWYIKANISFAYGLFVPSKRGSNCLIFCKTLDGSRTCWKWTKQLSNFFVTVASFIEFENSFLIFMRISTVTKISLYKKTMGFWRWHVLSHLLRIVKLNQNSHG